MDQDIINLAKAIRQKESGGKFDAVGDAGTSTGAYQFQEATWKSWAKQHLGDANAPKTRENQNKVAYKQIETWKNKGLSPAQIAAAWNAGEGKLKNDAWKQNVGETVINGQKIKYDTPSYVRDVGNLYQKIKSESQTQSQQSGIPQYETPQSATQAVGQAVKENLIDPFAERFGAIDYKNQGLGSNILQSAGAVVGGGLDVAGTGLYGAAELVAPDTTKAVTGGLSNVIKAIGSSVPQDVVSGLSNWATQHPEAAGNLNALLELSAVVPAGKGLGALKTVTTAGKASQTIEKTTGRIIQGLPEDVSPAVRTFTNQNLDVSKIKTYKELSDSIQKNIDVDLKRVTDELKTDTTKYRVENFNLDKGFGVKVNPVKDAISSLKELGNKTSDTKLLLELKPYEMRLSKGEFTTNDINELAKLLGKNKKSFGANGQLLKNTSAVKSENTRKELKSLARDGMSPELAKLDMRVHEAIDTKDLVDSMADGVFKQLQKAEEYSALRRLVGGAATTVDLLSGRLMSTILTRLARTGNSLNKIDIERELVKNLKTIKDLSNTNNKTELMKFLKGIGFIGASQSITNTVSPQNKPK